jgi:hypothetical protein
MRIPPITAQTFEEYQMTKSTMAAGLIAGLVAAVFATPSTADGRPDVFTVVSHEDEIYLIPANPECGAPVGSTEVQQGTEWHHAVGSDDSFHLVAGEAVWVYTTWDDPSLTPPDTRHIAHAIVIQSIKDEKVLIFHESYQDRNTYWGDISVNQTLVIVDGVLKVGNYRGRNEPPEGC